MIQFKVPNISAQKDPSICTYKTTRKCKPIVLCFPNSLHMLLCKPIYHPITSKYGIVDVFTIILINYLHSGSNPARC